jgi:hypothetical protein
VRHITFLILWLWLQNKTEWAPQCEKVARPTFCGRLPSRAFYERRSSKKKKKKKKREKKKSGDKGEN